MPASPANEAPPVTGASARFPMSFSRPIASPFHPSIHNLATSPEHAIVHTNRGPRDDARPVGIFDVDAKRFATLHLWVDLEREIVARIHAGERVGRRPRH